MGVEFGNCLNTNTFANTNAIENRDKCKIHNCFRIFKCIGQFEGYFPIWGAFNVVRARLAEEDSSAFTMVVDSEEGNSITDHHHHHDYHDYHHHGTVMIVSMVLKTTPTCHGHSLTSVSTPPTILVLLSANPHLQSPEAPPAKSSSHICQLSTTGSGEERGKKKKKDTGWQLWHDRLSGLSG